MCLSVAIYSDGVEGIGAALEALLKVSRLCARNNVCAQLHTNECGYSVCSAGVLTYAVSNFHIARVTHAKRVPMREIIVPSPYFH